MYMFGNDVDGALKDYTKQFQDNDPADENSYVTEPTLATLSISKGENGEVVVMLPSGIAAILVTNVTYKWL